MRPLTYAISYWQALIAYNRSLNTQPRSSPTSHHASKHHLQHFRYYQANQDRLSWLWRWRWWMLLLYHPLRRFSPFTFRGRVMIDPRLAVRYVNALRETIPGYTLWMNAINSSLVINFWWMKGVGSRASKWKCGFRNRKYWGHAAFLFGISTSAFSRYDWYNYFFRNRMTSLSRLPYFHSSFFHFLAEVAPRR